MEIRNDGMHICKGRGEGGGPAHWSGNLNGTNRQQRVMCCSVGCSCSAYKMCVADICYSVCCSVCFFAKLATASHVGLERECKNIFGDKSGRRPNYSIPI